MNVFEIESLMDEEIEMYYVEGEGLVYVLMCVGDVMLVFGIVVVVMGVVYMMVLVDKLLVVFGVMIVQVLVGMFFGILLLYGLIGLFVSFVE